MPPSPYPRTHPFSKLSLISEAQLAHIIYNIKKVDLEHASIDKLKIEFKKLLSYKLHIPLAYPYFYYYRAQKTTENSIKRLIYPDTKLVTSLGRCNNIGESLFYCSNCYVTAILETRPEKEEIVTILVMELLDVNDITHSNPTTILARGKIKDEIPDSFFLSNDILLNKKLKTIDKFFSDTMLQNVEKGMEWKYKISVALSQACFELSPNTGLLFPSLASEKYGVNFAMKPDWYEKTNTHNNRKVKAFRVKILEKKGSFSSVCLVTEVATDIDSSGMFLFKDISYLQKTINLDNSFYDEQEKVFQTQKQHLRQGDFFYRRYIPDFFYRN